MFLQSQVSIFKNPLEDFIKIFLACILVFFLSFIPQFLKSQLVILLTVYLLDGGHVYSTFLEVFADPEEIRKAYPWAVILCSFFFNLIILIFFNSYFFYYLFYFTVYHNLRQGLGITFLYRKGQNEGAKGYKISYYVLTYIPFLLFHFRDRVKNSQLGNEIIKSVDFSVFFSKATLEVMLHFGIILFLILVSGIAIWIFLKRQWKGIFSLIFFGLVYSYSFLISENEFRSYVLLIFSHAIPYLFLMDKRVQRTHSVLKVRNLSLMFLILFFILGGTLEFFHESILEEFVEINLVVKAFLTTPLIAHFIYDGFLWKKGNERFEKFLA